MRKKKFQYTVNYIGINKLNSLTSDPDCPFVLFIGHKKLIKRKPFEDFINNEFTQSL